MQLPAEDLPRSHPILPWTHQYTQSSFYEQRESPCLTPNWEIESRVIDAVGRCT
jgi:hypothetical protein